MGKRKEQTAKSLLRNDSTEPEKSLLESNSKVCAWGWRNFKPFWLQFFNSPKWFLFFLCSFSFLQGMGVNTFVSVSLPSLEKRFHLTSQMSGFIMSSNDITALILVVFVSFFGSYGHKTKWLGGGAIITGVACLLYTLPQFIADKYDPTGESYGRSPYCMKNATIPEDPQCRVSTGSFNVYYFILILSQLLAGAATTPLHTLGPAWLDENVHPKHLAVYLAAFYMSVFLGPGLGSVIGGQFLMVYVDVKVPPNTKLNPEHPNWVGAWWLGPFSCSFLLMICGVLLLGFPRHLPGADTIREHAIKSGHIRKQDKKLKGTFKDIIPATKSLLTNGTYIFQNLGTTTGSMIGLGVGPFIYKLLSGRYGLSPIYAGLGIAVLLLPGSAIGLGLGTFLVNKLGVKRSCRKAAKLTFFLQILGIAGSFAFLVPGCTYSKFAGVDLPYNNSLATEPKVMNTCNMDCQCSTSQFRPVCGPGNINYFSPCHAGCPAQSRKNAGPMTMDLQNCSCVIQGNVAANTSLSSPTPPKTVRNGMCEADCPSYSIFIFCGAAFMTVILGFSNAIPSKIVTMRSVPDNQRAYGLGIQFVFMRTLGALPGPVIIGTIIDHTCTLWKTKCGNPASCLNYDYNKLGYIITAYGFPPGILSLLFFFLSFYFSKDADPDATMSRSHAVDDILIDKKPILEDDEDETTADHNKNETSGVELDEEGNTIV